MIEPLLEDVCSVSEEAEPVKVRKAKQKGKRDADLKNLSVKVIEHTLPEDELRKKFGDSWRRLPDEVYKRLAFHPATFEVEEHHVAVYCGNDNETIVKAPRPMSLLRNSIATPSLEAAILNGKYTNAIPFYRMEQEFKKNGVNLGRELMASWTILCAERYFSLLYDRLHKGILAHDALKQISAIFKLEKELAKLSAEERLYQRQLIIQPLIEAFFVWIKSNRDKVLPQSETGKGFTYCVNQEKYLRVFLTNGNVPMDNNATEGAIRGFCIDGNNWKLIDTINGAHASAIIYSIVETAKVNNLKPYDYFKYLLEEIPLHNNDKDLDFLDNLLPWSPNLPDICRKPKETE